MDNSLEIQLFSEYFDALFKLGAAVTEIAI